MKYLLILLITISYAKYDCYVDTKVSKEKQYKKEEIDKYSPVISIQEDDKYTIISRCSFFEMYKRNACYSYIVDTIVVNDKRKMRKYYIYKTQYDIQIFNDKRFVENNGMGLINFGECEHR